MEPINPNQTPPGMMDLILGASIGVVSFLVRVLTSTDQHSAGYVIRRTAIAGMTSLLVGLAVGSYFSNVGMSYAASGMAGYASPELVEALLKRIKNSNKG
jgi:hypothetical protein